MKIVFILFIKFYKRIISPFLGPKCRFYPSCSSYSLTCFETLSIHRAIWYSGKRICKCHPFHPGGIDFPPEK